VWRDGNSQFAIRNTTKRFGGVGRDLANLESQCDRRDLFERSVIFELRIANCELREAARRAADS
jgi:hypothetical protein